MGLVLALVACAPASDATDPGTSAAATSETTVYGTIELVDAGSYHISKAANEPIELRVASVVLNAQGEPVAYAGGVPFVSCADAEATSRATTDANGRYEFSIAAPGTYCIWARGHELDFRITGEAPTHAIDAFVIDLNAYAGMCVLDAVDAAGKPVSCYTRRDIVGSLCHCQVSMNVYGAGKIVADQ